VPDRCCRSLPVYVNHPLSRGRLSCGTIHPRQSRSLGTLPGRRGRYRPRPRRPGRARFTHPVLRARVSLTVSRTTTTGRARTDTRCSSEPFHACSSVGYPCRIVDAVCGFRAPTEFLDMVLSTRCPPSLRRVLVSPVPRLRRYYESTTTSRRAPCPLMVSVTGPMRSSSFVLA